MQPNHKGPLLEGQCPQQGLLQLYTAFWFGSFLLNCQRLHESEEATLASYLHLGFVPFCESANELKTLKLYFEINV